MAATVPYSNTTASAITDALTQNGMLTNYQVLVDTPNRVVLGNRTAGTDKDIVVLTRANAPKGVISPDELLVEYPARLKKAAISTLATWTTVQDPATETKPTEEYPICFSLQLRSTLSSCATNDLLNDLWSHFLSSFPRLSDGSVDFRSLLLGAMKPQADNEEPD